jgi:hypothetical protein
MLKTDQPSMLFINMQGTLSKDGLKMRLKNQNIYITSDEKIKGGDYSIEITLGWVFKMHVHGLPNYNPNKKKVILTTDPTLIADGVQEIDDEFLQWFVKNPSCEEIEVFHQDVYSMGKWDRRYKIIIPQEEPKLGYVKSETEFSGIEYTLKDGSKQVIIIGEGLPKQETLEEAATRYTCGWGENDDEKAFIAGAKSDAARDYWFGQFKKK